MQNYQDTDIKQQRIHLMVGEVMYNFVAEQSYKENISMSAYVRRLIGIEMLKQNNNTEC